MNGYDLCIDFTATILIQYNQLLLQHNKSEFKYCYKIGNNYVTTLVFKNLIGE